MTLQCPGVGGRGRSPLITNKAMGRMGDLTQTHQCNHVRFPGEVYLEDYLTFFTTGW